MKAYQAADINRRRERLAEKLFREEQTLQQEQVEKQVKCPIVPAGPSSAQSPLDVSQG